MLEVAFDGIQEGFSSRYDNANLFKVLKFKVLTYTNLVREM